MTAPVAIRFSQTDPAAFATREGRIALLHPGGRCRPRRVGWTG